MKMKAAAIAITLSLIAGGVMAETSVSKRAYVVAVDAKAKTITLKHHAEIGGKEWTESVVHWDDSATWERSDKPATAEMVTSRKPASARAHRTASGGSPAMPRPRPCWLIPGC